MTVEIPYTETTPTGDVFHGHFSEGSVTVSDDSGDLGDFRWRPRVIEVNWRGRRYEVRMEEVMLAVVKDATGMSIKDHHDLKEALYARA